MWLFIALVSARESVLSHGLYMYERVVFCKDGDMNIKAEVELEPISHRKKNHKFLDFTCGLSQL
jgi:hypothetical protein